MASLKATKPGREVSAEPVSKIEQLGGPLNPPNTPTARKVQAPPDATPLVGLRVRLRRTIDVPCGVCGATTVVIGQGVGPHAAALHCAACARHRGWLPKAIAEFLLAAISRFGWPQEAITIRNCEFAQANEAAPSGAIAAANVRILTPH